MCVSVCVCGAVVRARKVNWKTNLNIYIRAHLYNIFRYSIKVLFDLITGFMNMLHIPGITIKLHVAVMTASRGRDYTD